jgi:hypothetical protein
MLTYKQIQPLLESIRNQENIACYFSIKEQFNVNIKSLELLGLVKAIKRYVPSCGKHCPNYANCQWQDIFLSNKSKCKFKLTSSGEEFLNEIKDADNTILEKQLNELLSSVEITNEIMAILQDNNEGLSLAELVRKLSKATSYTTRTFRITLFDLLALLKSLKKIKQEKGKYLA